MSVLALASSIAQFEPAFHAPREVATGTGDHQQALNISGATPPWRIGSPFGGCEQGQTGDAQEHDDEAKHKPVEPHAAGGHRAVAVEAVAVHQEPDPGDNGQNHRDDR
jgi:hypothetical protein